MSRFANPTTQAGHEARLKVRETTSLTTVAERAAAAKSVTDASAAAERDAELKDLAWAIASAATLEKEADAIVWLSLERVDVARAFATSLAGLLPDLAISHGFYAAKRTEARKLRRHVEGRTREVNGASADSSAGNTDATVRRREALVQLGREMFAAAGPNAAHLRVLFAELAQQHLPRRT